jgi:hypothetical protein
MSPPLTERAVNLPSNNSPPKSNSESPVKMMNLNQVPGLGQGQGQGQGQIQGQRGIQNSESIDSFQDSQPILPTQPMGIQESPRQMEVMQQQQQQQQLQQQQAQQQPHQIQQQQQPQFQQLQQQPEPVDLAPPIRSAPQQQQQQQANGPQPNGPPQRPRREGDEEYRRAMSPPNGPPSPTNPTHRVVSPTNAKNDFNSSILGTRSPSPRMRMADGDTSKPVPPADAFYYGRSPTANGFSPIGRPNSLHGSGSSELMSQLKSRDAELEAGRKREAGLRVILSKAMQAGFVADVDNEEESENGDVDGDEDSVGKLTDALVRLKHEKASIQVSFPSVA